MGRKKRVWYPGAIYHVMSRGNRRTTIFKERADFHRFLECIKWTKEKYDFKIHALCLMTNHFHMVIETKDVELYKIMHRMLHPYSMYFNYKYNFTGHVFESRYTACVIEDERYFLEVSRYIHLNPVKAHMVLTPVEYEYSSYSTFISEEANTKKERTASLISGLVDTSRVLEYFSKDNKNQYKGFVEDKISHEEHELEIQREMKEDDKWLPKVPVTVNKL